MPVAALRLSRRPLPRGSAAQERAADSAAARSLAEPTSQPGLRCACGGDCPRCRPRASGSFQAAGTALPADLRRRFEPRLGADLGAVRVHTDERAARAAAAAGAAAYTWGTNVVFGRGYWAPRTSAGQRLLAHELAHVVQQAGKPPVLQRQKQPTGWGEFESTQFQAAGSGVEINLTFDPDPAKCDASKIGLVQAVRYVDAQGTALAVNPTIANRIAPAGKPGAGFAIDASGATNNPLYFDLPNVAAGKALKDTPNAAAGLAGLGTRTHFVFGHCHVPPGAKAKVCAKAGLHDHPEGILRPGYGMTFETAALALDGHDAGTYYGSVAWGYTVDGATNPPTIKGQDINSPAAKPGPAFTAAATQWNAGRTRGTIVVAPTAGGNQQSAWVQYVSGGAGQPARQPAGTQLRFVRAVKGSTEPMIEAEVLDAAGKGTGVVIQIYVTDTRDRGDGAANTPLPLPAP